MIKHIVMWNLAGETPQANREACMFLKACFEGLAGRIPGLIKIEVGWTLAVLITPVMSCSTPSSSPNRHWPITLYTRSTCG